MIEELLERLAEEKKYQTKGGIYNKLQVDFAYNSNHIEGSRLTHDQTKYIYDTHTIGIESANVDDVFETVNHFRCFDYILDTYRDNISEEYIKELHRLLKTGTFSSQSKFAVVGDYKKYANEVGGMETVSPEEVPEEMESLLTDYIMRNILSLDDILDFHSRFEKIHPFYDGNGRVGRLIMFKECLKNDIIPFIIRDDYKFEYNRGLNMWQTKGERGYLRETCLLMQDHMKTFMDYFEIEY